MKKIVLFASGSGTNVENIVKNFEDNQGVEISCVFTNNPNAYVIERCKSMGVKCSLFGRSEFREDFIVLDELKTINPDLIVLAGFLWLVPNQYVEAFPNKIINIHPALLPKYGGKGMYGDKVHQAVVDNKDTESGITIHYVNEKYDDGNIIKQVKCALSHEDTADDVASKVHKLEYEYFPLVIKELLGV